ncbi:cation diffusion facilitator CzcD-associated flavoprotein CzcO [Saccharopolyspora dendranthemae]|uniref:Cation diffusion facilitator CzcD-associated flavoprotein CzcO n=1 Tax=Saccharopolyspora dendranthemae TaxID=1181886 RepID=A0A561U7G8_9PSEU|nr:cation diffusion facilitator CzcD-associated flavoprotein CzcO [Saccharopolyspora dendranthemae]
MGTVDSHGKSTSDQLDHRDVCVIGAGISGLAMMRSLKQRGVTFVALERDNDVGGVWNFGRSSSQESHPAYDSLHLNTSSKVTGFTGFPVPEDFPRYPRHDQVASYLRRFADEHDLTSNIEFGAHVHRVEPAPGGGWLVTSGEGGESARTRHFRNVVLASGYHSVPRHPDPDFTGSELFRGRRLHSTDYTSPEPFRDQAVAVVGFGNSACDIAAELSRVASRTVLSIRRGAHVVPKTLMGMPIDEIAASRWWSFLPFKAQRKLIEVLLHLSRGRITDYGLPEPDHRVMEAPITVSDELLSRLSHGEITVRPGIRELTTEGITFSDGSAEDVDAVVLCTGYDMSLPVPDDVVFDEDGRLSLFQRIVPPGHDGLYLAGFLRPVGALTRLAELQAEWIGELVTGEAHLPAQDEMVAEVRGHLSRSAGRYGAQRPEDALHVDVPSYVRGLKQERRQGRERPADATSPARQGNRLTDLRRPPAEWPSAS